MASDDTVGPPGEPGFERLEQLFFELIDLGAAERSERLAGLRSGDDTDRALAVAVQAMLTEDGETLFGQSRAAPSDLLERVGQMSRPVRDELPRDVGNYRLLRRLGEGGMGAVYEAQQQRPVRRRVAVKLVKWGMDTRAVLARFDAERQTLARLDHPHIASVYDADVTVDGRPFFVMELVDGESITDYCDRLALTLDQRLDLFAQLCGAVQHAHQRGVIHRDLKPGNVLVTRGEGSPRVKVIDFGIAKATDLDGDSTRLTGRTALTRQGEFVGTPEYMSPEQAGLGDGVVDTRTDVYALGVVLYELLVGELPIRPESRGRISVEEVRRMVREVDAARPSSRLRQGATELGAVVAQRRATTVSALRRRLEGDLDWIVLRALAKDPERRYASVADFAADVQRHREWLPVEAGPPSWRYRAGRFVRRHRAAVLMSAALTLAVLLGAGLALSGLLRARTAERVAVDARGQAEREARTATEVSAFLVDLFEATDPLSDTGPITATEILERAVAEVDRLEQEPLVQATLLNTFGKVYTNQGDYERAEPLIVRASELAAAHDGDGGLQAQVLSRLLILYRRLGRPAAAVEAGERAVQIERRLGLTPGEAGLGAALSNLASAYADAGRLEEAVAAAREAVPLCAQEKGEDSNSVAFALNNLATNLMRQDQYAEAISALERTRDLFTMNLGSEHPYLVQVQSNLAHALGGAGRRREALAASRAALAAADARLQPDHPGRIVPNINLSAALGVLGLYAEAESVLATARRIAKQRLTDSGHPRWIDLHRHASHLAWRQGLLEKASRSARREVELLRRAAPADERQAPTLVRLAVLAVELGRPGEAMAVCGPMLESSAGSATRAQCALVASLIAWRSGDEVGARSRFAEALVERDSAELRDPGAAISLAGYWALRGDSDRAFDELELGPGGRWASAWIVERSQLTPLHGDRRWAPFSDSVRAVLEIGGGAAADRCCTRPSEQSRSTP